MDEQDPGLTAEMIAAEAVAIDDLQPHDVLHAFIGLHRSMRSTQIALREAQLTIVQRDRTIAELTQELVSERAKPKRRAKKNEPAVEPGHAQVPTATVEAVRQIKELANGRKPAHADA